MVIDIEKSLSTQPGKVFLAKDFRLIRDRQSLIITPNKSIEIADIEVHIDVNQIATPFLMQFEIIEVDSNFEVPKLASIGAFDFSKLKFPLKLRLWREGDWFVPFGMTGRKKVSDFLIDQKLPLHHKEGIYVLESNDEIIWVVGQRTDNRYRITDGCKKIFMVRLG
jgi:tRNA(Ile)-lysidine synthase